MSDKRILILGGGISGLLAAYALRKHNPVIIEASDRVGGTFGAGGLKYIRRTPAFEQLLKELGVPWKPYTPRGGLALWSVDKGENGKAARLVVKPHPDHLRELPEHERLQVQLGHWLKTRGTPEGFRGTCMNDPLGEGSAEAMDLDHDKLVDALASRAIGNWSTFHLTRVTAISDDHVTVDGALAGSWPYTHLVTTLPLPLMAKLAPQLKLPTPSFKMVTVAFFNSLPPQLAAAGGADFDYIYTPAYHTVHRISKTRDGWQAEASGKHFPEAFESDLQMRLTMALTNLPGHLIPLTAQPEWPSNIVPLGRFAEWDTRSTSEKSLDRALELSKTWT